jgi:hypothetical protein
VGHGELWFWSWVLRIFGFVFGACDDLGFVSSGFVWFEDGSAL